MYISGNRRSAILALLIVLLVFGSPTPAGIDAAQSSRFTSAAEPETIPGVEIPVIAVPGDGQQSYVAPPAALGQPRTQSATISVTYSGFTPEAQAAFQLAVDIWETQITSTVPITVSATWRPLDANILGSAGPTAFFRDFVGAPQANTFYPVALANKLASQDLDTTHPDITANFSSAITDWYFGSGATPTGKYNFTSVVLHELGHGLGWVGSEAYSGGTGSWGYRSSFSSTLYPAIYDRFVVSGTGQRMLDTTTFGNPSIALGSFYTSDALFVDGAQAKSANGVVSPKLYAPATWSGGSSVSHLDETTYPKGNPNSLMTYAISSGESIYDPGPIVRGMFADMGWAIDNSTRQELLVSPTTIAFGNTIVGTTSTARTVTLLNNGTAPITLTAASSTNAAEFPTTTDCAIPGTLAGGASCSYTVSFHPQALSLRGGQLSISSNSPSGTQMVALSGTGVASIPSPSPSSSPSPAPSTSPNPSAAPLALTVTSSVGGAAAPASNAYPAGTPLTLHATAQPGYRFVGWTINGQARGWANPLSLTITTAFTVQASFAAIPAFSDLSSDRPNSTAIAELAARGIIRGYGDGTFGPDDRSLRAQMAALIARAMEYGDNPTNPFTDRCDPAAPSSCVDGELWQRVAQLAARGIARGYAYDLTVAPNDPRNLAVAATCGGAPNVPCYAPRDQVLHAQILSFITRAMISQGYWSAQPSDPTIFGGVLNGTGHEQDVATYIFNTQGVGGVPGYPTSGGFGAWNQPATRGWFAQALWAALNSYVGSDQPGLGGYVP
jgi:hypothetical protein